MNTTDLVKRVRYARRLFGWSRRHLSERAGLAKNFVGQLEAGEIQHPSLRSVEAIARAIPGCERKWLAFGEGAPPAPPAEVDLEASA